MAATLKKWVRHPIEKYGGPSLFEGIEVSSLRVHPIVGGNLIYRDAKVGQFVILVRGGRYYFFRDGEFVTALDYKRTWYKEEPYAWHIYLQVDIDEEPKELTPLQMGLRIAVVLPLAIWFAFLILKTPLLIVVAYFVAKWLWYWVRGKKFGVLYPQDIPSLPQCNPSRQQRDHNQRSDNGTARRTT